MPPKKSKVQSKQGDEVIQQVGTSDMASGEDNTHELSVLIRAVIREEISVVLDKLNVLTDDISVCTRKLGEVDETLSNMDSRITKLELVCEGLRKTNEDLKDKAERLEIHSRKYNLRVYGLTSDIEKGNPTSYMSVLFKELFHDKVQSEPEVENAHRIGPAGKTTGKSDDCAPTKVYNERADTKNLKERRCATCSRYEIEDFPGSDDGDGKKTSKLP
ncbi:hypothetical protein ABG768_027946 [Culter alburnus]|uniref:Uncharacterized protein n=1 Tax=Culter alburnus TaxID=194366 RepID=A0AAW2AB12_CULAL